MAFGNGVPWGHYTADMTLTADGVRSLAAWFLLLRPRKDADEEGAFNDPTGSFDRALPRSPTGSFMGASSSSSQRFVFRVVRQPGAHFDFISIGRNEKNDIFLPDQSVSRFHAFMREGPEGLSVLDGKSNNGTMVAGVRVPRQNEGEPVHIMDGDNIRIGDIHGVVLTAESLFKSALAERA